MICVKAYNYWWGYTSAQIDLMVADSPIIVYNKDKKKDKYGTKKHTKREMDELVAKWNSLKTEREERGEKLDLNSFLGKGNNATAKKK